MIKPLLISFIFLLLINFSFAQSDAEKKIQKNNTQTVKDSSNLNTSKIPVSTIYSERIRSTEELSAKELGTIKIESPNENIRIERNKHNEEGELIIEKNKNIKITYEPAAKTK